MSDDFWPRMRTRLASEFPTYRKRLKTWPTLHRIPLWSPTVGDPELGYLRELLAAQSSLPTALEEPRAGHTRASYDQTVFRPGQFVESAGDDPRLSAWTVKTNHHVMKLERFHDLKSYETIIELGAGFGELARTISVGGFAGDYLRFDFPEVLAISDRYLADCQIPARHRQTVALDRLSSRAFGRTLVIGTWSYSEMPWDLRVQLAQSRALVAADWFIIFQSNFGTMNNVDFFTRSFPGLVDARVTIEPIPFHYFQHQGWSYHLWSHRDAPRKAGRRRRAK